MLYPAEQQSLVVLGRWVGSPHGRNKHSHQRN
jgi:hypothetical protein